MTTHLTLSLLIALMALGAIAGFAGGILSIGGGILFIPGLLEIYPHLLNSPEFTVHLAIMTSLLMLIPVNLKTFYSHKKNNNINKNLIIAIIPFAILGTMMGYAIALFLNKTVLMITFSGVVLAAGLRLLFRHSPLLSRNTTALAQTQAAMVGISASVVTSITGATGNLLLTSMLNQRGVQLKKALSTAACFGIVIGTIVLGSNLIVLPFWQAKFIVEMMLIMTPTAVICAHFGVKLANRLSENILRKIAASVMIIIAITTLASIG